MKIVLQDGIKDCGICALLSIIRFYGGDVSKEYLRELTSTTKSGVSAYKLLLAATKLGFTGYGAKGDIKEINNDNLPCIAHVIINKSYQHFVVVYNIDLSKEKILIMDPAEGKRNLSLSEFRLLSSNNYLFLKPNRKLPVILPQKIIATTIKSFLKNKKYYLILISILSFIYFILNIISAFHFKYLLDYAINFSLTKNIFLISLSLFLIYFLKEFNYLLRDIILLKWTALFDEEITSKTYRQIILLPYLYYKNRTTGEVISRLKDLGTTKNFLAKLMCSLTTDLATLTIFIIFMFHINTILTYYTLLIVLFLFLFNTFINKKTRDANLKYYEQEEKVNSELVESLASVEVVKGLHLEQTIINRFHSKYKMLLSKSYHLSLLEELSSFIKNNLNNILLTIIYALGVYYVINHKLTLGSLIVYEALFHYFMTSINNLLALESSYHNYHLAVTRVEELFTINKENFIGANYYHMYNLAGDIVYKNLTYAYTSTNLFTNLNLTIKNGTKLLITGSSGSGKSTLVKMLMRYIEIPFGMLSINKIDINHYHLEVLRNNITYLAAQEFLFTATLYDNIVMNREVDNETLATVCKLTLVDEIVNNDKLGYQKLVEENGFNFSSGERQRIIMARTLLKPSDIYIFDEALSGVDIDKERLILTNIFAYLKDKTIIVISHRFNNKDLFDKVLTLENGVIND
jgi:ABC-type bacteriocin/lantibiotic exporter with double-glycine peptidase domain